MRLSEKPLFKEYLEIWQNSLPEILSKYQFAETKAGEEYQIQSSAVFSSNIEGNTLDLNSYMNAKLSKEIFGKRKEIQEIDDLVDAYEFAKKHDLNEKNFLKSHEILSKELLIKSLRGKYRSDKVGVFGSEGLVYLAVEAEFVKNEMQKLFADIQELLKTEINVAGVFYFALRSIPSLLEYTAEPSLISKPIFSTATSISFSTARVSAQIVGHVTAFDISTTLLKSPGLDTGKPASITSTPSSSRALAT